MTTALRLQPYFSAIVSAVLIWLAFPGGGELSPLLAAGLVPLLTAAAGLPFKKAFLAGWFGGFVLHLLLVYWIVTVLGKYGGLPLFIAVPALLLLASYMALYFGGAAAVGGLVIKTFSPVAALVCVPLVWVGFDWLRSMLFSGFPWMDLGYGLAGSPKLIQVADIFGHSGVTFLIVMVNTLAVVLIRDRRVPRRCLAPTVFASVVLGVSLTYSDVRYRDLDAQFEMSSQPTIKIGIVQGNIDQNLKWSEEQQQKTVDIYIRQTAKLAEEGEPSIVVWPETALPFYPALYPGMDLLFQTAKRYNTALLTGAPWYEIVDAEKRDVDFYNSAQILLPEGGYGESYYKSHLVPFGEYVPMRRFLPFLEPLVEAVGDFSPGEVEKTLDWGAAKIGVLICFESIFPDIGREWVKNGANILVNLTNDAWYGKSSAPYQSMAMTSFRAVETRRSIVRSANTGISGFIDPLGRAAKSSPIFIPWRGAEEVPLLRGETVFVRWGYLFGPLCFAAGLLIIMPAAVRSRMRAGRKGKIS